MNPSTNSSALLPRRRARSRCRQAVCIGALTLGVWAAGVVARGFGQDDAESFRPVTPVPVVPYDNADVQPFLPTVQGHDVTPPPAKPTATASSDASPTPARPRPASTPTEEARPPAASVGTLSNTIGGSALVFQSDFGVKDGAVAAMKGVAVGVNPRLRMYDLTHEIPAFNVWEAAYRLWQTAPYWPAGTVFVSVVDPGVGTERKSVVARTKNGQFFVTPDNGTLSLIAERLGLDAVREIDEARNRRPGSEASYTFHGRDVYAYTGARLAAGVVKFEEIGPVLDASKLVTLAYLPPMATPSLALGGVAILDPQYGNVWTNIDQGSFQKLQPPPKPGERFEVTIVHGSDDYVAHLRDHREAAGGAAGAVVFKGVVPFVNSFGDVPVGQPLLYLNSLMDLSLAINQGNFAAEHKVGSGPAWLVSIKRSPAPGDKKDKPPDK